MEAADPLGGGSKENSNIVYVCVFLQVLLNHFHFVQMNKYLIFSSVPHLSHSLLSCSFFPLFESSPALSSFCFSFQFSPLILLLPRSSLLFPFALISSPPLLSFQFHFFSPLLCIPIPLLRLSLTISHFSFLSLYSPSSSTPHFFPPLSSSLCIFSPQI